MSMDNEEKAAKEHAARLKNQNAQLRAFVVLVQNGLNRGTIKSQPIISMPAGAKEWPIQSLEELADEVLKNTTP